jgi:Predicted transcriptional regulator
MPPRSPSISESEWIVADVLWSEDGLTAAEVAARLPRSGWKQKTVNTFLTRLVAKGVLTAEPDGRAYRYRVKVPRDRCVRAETESFVQRVFRGATAPLLAHFCETAELSDEEIERLRGILDSRLKGSERKK